MEPTADALDWSVILRGAAAGLTVIVPVTILRAVLDRDLTDFNSSGWVYPLFVLILAAYGLAGWVAGRGAPRAPLTYGALAGLGSVLLWIPVRVVIWAVREQGRGLFRGTGAALPPGQVLGALVIAAVLGMLGGIVGARGGHRPADETRTPTSAGS